MSSSENKTDEAVPPPESPIAILPISNGTLVAAAEVKNPFEGLAGIRFGRYNDNNKSYTKTQSWYKAEELYKEKKYTEAFAAVFDYLADEEEQNVIFKADGNRFTFELIQGSKKISGECDGHHIIIYAPIALMETPSVPVMRRMLDMNYSLYYSRASLNDKNELCMVMDTTVPMATPNTLYYGLRELATKADRQDDLLLADFTSLKPAGTDHIEPTPTTEAAIKYRYFRKWTQDALERSATLNQDSFAGAIAYIYLSLLYRIEFLFIPEAGLLAELERISSLYWAKKEDTALVERNQLMKEAITKLLDISEDKFSAGIYRTKATFAIAPPAPADKYKENITSANRDAAWYVDNKYPDLALILNEYGVVYNNYAYSVPRLQKDLSTIYMAVMHAAFFKELGMHAAFYDPENKTFNQPAIELAVNNALNHFPDKYDDLHWDHSKIKYDSLYEFAMSFTTQMANLNLELKK